MSESPEGKVQIIDCNLLDVRGGLEFLRPTNFEKNLLGITKLDKEKNQRIREKNGSTEYSEGNKTVPGKVATTCTEDGHKRNTKTSVKI